MQTKIKAGEKSFSIQHLLSPDFFDEVGTYSRAKLRRAYRFLMSYEYHLIPTRKVDLAFALIIAELQARENRKAFWISAALAAIAIVVSIIQIFVR